MLSYAWITLETFLKDEKLLSQKKTDLSQPSFQYFIAYRPIVQVRSHDSTHCGLRHNFLLRKSETIIECWKESWLILGKKTTTKQCLAWVSERNLSMREKYIHTFCRLCIFTVVRVTYLPACSVRSPFSTGSVCDME